MRKPYVILIGSASGIGKSTIAAELAKQLNIKHLIESDFIRAVVRGIIGKEYAPALHNSSYEAYKSLRNKFKYDNYDELVSAGFDEHASYVIPAIEKIIQRAITDFDDIIIEGVHLVPGLIDIKKFQEDANIYFFILSSDEEAHKERFVKRAIQIHRGGKQLDFFKENRIIHDHLISQAKKFNATILETGNIENTLSKLLKTINQTCKTIRLTNTIDDLENVIDIIIKKNNSSIIKIVYKLDEFKDSLVRDVNITDTNEASKFIKNLNENKDKKEDLNKLYTLSKYREFTICAPNEDKLNNIINELTKRGFVYNE
ncbi:3H domain-containing protein [uncultured Methanobrevibacter sp.]|uniref:3H domain-containing protein n=1 Tax=uncultured Methanobrevibacter sp. TaxID=253161 RepID=UPI00261AD748|nr:3H domain-containing protein [uncultured Methanobrevibacter sp.]